MPKIKRVDIAGTRYEVVMPQPHPPRLTLRQVTLLRHVLAGDPHRDRVGGAPGKRQREARLDALWGRGLIRPTSAGFWRLTMSGRAVVEHYIEKGWLRRPPSRRLARA